MYKYYGKVLKTVDGDTFDILIDLGFGTHTKKRIRIYGVDAWESRTKDKEEKEKGKAAKKFLKDLINKKIISIETIKNKRGIDKKTFDRYLANVFITINGELVNVGEKLIENGHAKIYYK